MTVRRFLANLLLALLLLVLAAAIMLVGYGLVMSQAWETYALEQAATEGQWASVGGIKYHYRTAGSAQGDAVVLIHGLGVEGLQAWNDNMAALAKAGLYVIAVDLRGFGYSARDASATYSLRTHARSLAELLSQLQVSKATLIGHGWGCAVALQAAADHPQFVRQLVFVAPLLQNSVPVWPTMGRIPYLGRSVAWIMASGGPWWQIQRRLGFYNQAALSAELWASMIEPTHIRGTVDGILAMSRSPLQTDPATTLLGTLQLPLLIIRGEQDRFVSQESVDQIARGFQEQQTLTIPRAGHYVHVENSQATNRSIIEFCLGSGR